MSTVKISELNTIPQLNSNTANTLLVAVDLSSGTPTTGKITATTLATGLYSNNSLVVGNNAITLANVIAQFSGNTAGFLQTNMQNFGRTGSVDYVATTSDGTDANSYIDLGINNPSYSDPTFSAYRPYDGYLYVAGPTTSGYQGNLILGTTSANANIVFVVGGTLANDVTAWVTTSSITLNTSSYLTFGDGTIQRSAVSNGYVQAAFNVANTASANTIVIQGIDTTQNSWISSNAAFSQAAFNKANSALANTSGAIFAGDLTVTGNIVASYITGNVVGSSIANTIQWLPLTNAPTQSSGQLWYSANDNSLIEDTDIAGDRPIIGKVLFERVYNGTGTTIAANSWVRLAGSVTANAIPYVALADAGSSANASPIGIVKNAIVSGGYGICYVQGIVNNINMSPFTTGDNLFLSTTAGLATNVAPTGANTVIQLGKVLNNNTSNGKIQVSVVLAPQFGKSNGAILYANNNTIVASNTFLINDSAQTLSMTGTVTMNTNTFATTSSALRLNGSQNFAAQQTTQSGTMLQVIGLANTPTRIITDSYSNTGNAYSVWAGRHARGAAASPTASQSGDVLARFSGNGYGATGYAPLGVGRMDIVAAENYSDTNKGSYIYFSVTPIGSNVISSNVVSISSNGMTILGNTVPTQNNSTWTPSINFASGSGTYTTQVGTYIKVGKMVFATFNIVATAAGTGNISMNISSLFATSNISNSVSGSLVVSQVGGSVSSSVIAPQGSIPPGANSVPIYTTYTTSGGGGSTTYRQITGADLGSTFQMSGTIHYISAN